MPVRIMDLSEGGCYIESAEEQPLGKSVILKISLPDGASLVVEGEILYLRPGTGYAVLFNGMADAGRADLERALARLRQLTR